MLEARRRCRAAWIARVKQRFVFQGGARCLSVSGAAFARWQRSWGVTARDDVCVELAVASAATQPAIDFVVASGVTVVVIDFAVASAETLLTVEPAMASAATQRS